MNQQQLLDIIDKQQEVISLQKQQISILDELRSLHKARADLATRMVPTSPGLPPHVVKRAHREAAAIIKKRVG